MRIPLYIKITGWFLLNLAFVFLGFWLFIRAHFPGTLDAFLMGPAATRIDSVAQLVVTELETSNRAEWSSNLTRIGEAYAVQLFLVTGEAWIPAPVDRIPPAVEEAIRQRTPPPGPRGPGPGRRPPPPDKERKSERLPFPKALVRADERFWVLIDLPPLTGPDRTDLPQKLVIESSSLAGGGLFLDVSPWLGITAAVLGFSILFWLPLLGGITQTISRLTGATKRIAEGRFDVRVPATRRDELGSLAESINHMTERLDGLVNGQKRFLGDVAHELCSPLARMELALGILEQKMAESDRASLADVQEEVRSMSELAAELLSFSKASLAPKHLKMKPVDLAGLAQNAIRREKVPNAKVKIPEKLQALGQAPLLERALANLLRNAMRYAGSSDPILIRAEKEKKHILLSVSDSGPGIPKSAQSQIFDPFFRPESSRSRDSGGTGLGLAIVKTCVESCGGTVSCHNRHPRGLVVVLRLRALR